MGYLIPDWPVPKGVKAVVSTRTGGVSLPPYDSFNLGDHVGDESTAVAENRRSLQLELGLNSSPTWLQQVHGIGVIDATDVVGTSIADAVFSHHSGLACTVMTADCLPVLLCDRRSQVVAAIHAGWRGLADGVVEATIKRMGVAPEQLLAWLGPAIGSTAFEVGDEVRDLFVAHDPIAEVAFSISSNRRWLADIYLLARQRLAAAGLSQVFGGQFCTYTDSERFFSYRRDGITGRTASLIWLDKE